MITSLIMLRAFSFPLRCRNKFDFFGQNIVALTTTDAVNFG
jgi:hypothetical protein